jgi:hypothetical protein
MAKLPTTPQTIATFDLDPAPNCPRCGNKVMQVQVDGIITMGELTRNADHVVADVSLSRRTLTALPCGCLLDGSLEGGD